MKTKLLVITQEHRTWPESVDPTGRKIPAGESFTLICQDMSLPAESRMTENLLLKLKTEKDPNLKGKTQVEHYWNNSADKFFDVAIRRIVTGKNGKASIVGDILNEAK